MNEVLPPRGPRAPDPWQTAEMVVLRLLTTVTVLIVVLAHRPHLVISILLVAGSVVADVVRWHLSRSRRQHVSRYWWQRASTADLAIYGVMIASLIAALVPVILPESHRAICSVLRTEHLQTVSALAAEQFLRIPDPCDQKYIFSFFVIFLLFPMTVCLYAIYKPLAVLRYPSSSQFRKSSVLLVRSDLRKYTFLVQVFVLIFCALFFATPYLSPGLDHILHVYSSLFGIFWANIMFYLNLAGIDSLLYIENRRETEE